MKQLFLADLAKMTDAEVRTHLCKNYNAPETELKKYRIRIAYESVGDYGCDSNSFFLLQKKATGDFFEIHGSHCSCYGFEDQFQPELSPLEYLQSENFSFYTGGYDDNGDNAKKAVKAFLKKLKNRHQ